MKDDRRESTARQRWVLGLTSIASMMVALDALVVATALTTIRTDLGASVEALEWTVNAYSLCFAVLLMTAAALGDRLGRRRIFAAGLVVFATASAACALAPGIGSLIAARAVQGSGAAMVMPQAMALLTAAFPPQRRGKALGVFSGVTGLAVAGGPLVGGVVTEGLDWRWVFWLNVPLALVVVPLARRRIEESRGPAQPLDTGGVMLVSGASFGLAWGLVRGNVAGWSSAEVLVALAAGVALVPAFVVWESGRAQPMLPMRLFRSRAFRAGSAAGFFLYGALYGAVFLMAQFFQAVLGYGPLGAGLRVFPWTATLMVVAPIAGARVERLGARRLAVVGLALQAAGLAWVGLVAAPGMAYTALVLPLLIAGCGVSMAMPAAQLAVMNSVEREELGKASGAFNMLRQLGGVFGVAILTAVFASAGGVGSAREFSGGFVPAIVVAAVLSAAGALAAATAPARRTKVLERSGS